VGPADFGPGNSDADPAQARGPLTCAKQAGRQRSDAGEI